VIIISLKRQPDNRWSFVMRSKRNNVPLATSANSYSSLDDCLGAVKGLAREQASAIFEVVEEREEGKGIRS
jgi:hypothetical protein